MTIPHQKAAATLTATAIVAALVVAGCGDASSTGSPDSYPRDARYGEAPPTVDPAAVLQDQMRDAEALSRSSQMGHEARMNAYDTIAP